MEKTMPSAIVFANSEGEALSMLTLTFRDSNIAPTTEIGKKLDGKPKLHPNRAFASGKGGFYAGDKVMFNGKRYQVSCSVTEIGS